MKSPCAGHGCGHNALAAAVTGGGLAIAQDIQKGQVKGKVTVLGDPAEELLIGKGRMAESGLFDECDVLLSCHPNDVNYVWQEPVMRYGRGSFRLREELPTPLLIPTMAGALWMR